MYRALAEAVVVAHFVWILFLMFGALAGARNRAFMALHMGGLLFAIAIQIFGWYCPLTYLEHWLRGLEGPVPPGPGSFIARYAERLVYLEVSPALIFSCTVLLLLANSSYYLWRAAKRRRGGCGDIDAEC